MIQKKEKKAEKVRRPEDHGRKHNESTGASGVPGRGGSRQGNIGHEGGENNDNSHR